MSIVHNKSKHLQLLNYLAWTVKQEMLAPLPSHFTRTTFCGCGPSVLLSLLQGVDTPGLRFIIVVLSVPCRGNAPCITVDGKFTTVKVKYTIVTHNTLILSPPWLHVVRR